MTRQAIQLTVPKPCEEAWDNMQPAQGGRHCASCQKVVIDFSRMTDAQLLDYFRKNNGGCGRFTSEQLDRVIKEVVVPRSNWWARVAAGILVLLGLGKNAEAQNQSAKPDTEQYASVGNEQKQIVVTDSVQPGIYGTLFDGKGLPLINAYVEVSKEGTVFGRDVTDIDGSYCIKPLEAGVYTVKFSFQNRSQIVNDVVVSRERVKVCATIQEIGFQMTVGIISVGPRSSRELPEPPGQHTFRDGDNLPKH